MRDEAVPVSIFKDDNDYRIWGIHFFNRNERIREFSDDLKEIIDNHPDYEYSYQSAQEIYMPQMAAEEQLDFS